MSKENKSIISTLFTDAELKELEFTPEEIADIEEAETAGSIVDIMPSSDKDIDAFFDKFDAMFPANDTATPAEIYNRFVGLCEKDPTFQAQIVSMMFIIDQVEDIPEAVTEKVSLDDINKEKAAELNEAQKAKLARFDALLKSAK